MKKFNQQNIKILLAGLILTALFLPYISLAEETPIGNIEAGSSAVAGDTVTGTNNNSTVQKVISTVAKLGLYLIPGIGGYLLGKDVATGALSFIDEALKKNFVGICGIIFSIVGDLVGLMADLFNIGLSLTSYTKATVVQEGWKIVLGFANMFFALILVVIAFATITGNATYGYKSLLGKLIFAAVIINFSLIICGAIIDISQIFMFHFLDKMDVKKGVSQQLLNEKGMNLTKITEFSTSDKKNKNWLGKDASIKSNNRWMVLIVNLIFGLIFLIVALLAFLGGWLLIVWRMIQLWILVIFSPLAWVASILPQTQKYFSDWWNKFINQVMVGPVYIFFIWLAMQFITKGGAENISMAAASGEEWHLLIMQYAVVIGLMFGGFIAAPQFGNGAANIVLNAAKKAGQSASKWARGQAGSMAAEAGRGLSKTGAYQGLANWMAGKPLIGRLGTQMQLGAAELAARQQKEIDDRGKRFAPLSARDQGNAFKSGSIKDKIAILDNLSKDPTKLAASGLSPQQIKDTLAIAKQRGVLNKDTKLRNLEHLSQPEIDETIKNLKGDDASKLSEKSFDAGSNVRSAIERELNKVDAAGKYNGSISAQNLVDFRRNNPNIDVKSFLESTAINGDLKKDIANHSGRSHLGIVGKTKSEIVDRETERRMMDPSVHQKINDDRQNDIKTDTARYTAAIDTKTGQDKIDAEKKLREDMDLEKAAGSTNTNAFLATEATKIENIGKTADQIRREVINRAAEEDKHNRREALRNLTRNTIETNLSRDATAATPPPAGSLAHQYRNAFEFHS